MLARLRQVVLAFSAQDSSAKQSFGQLIGGSGALVRFPLSLWRDESDKRDRG